MEKSRKGGRKDVSFLTLTSLWHPGLYNLPELLPNPHSQHGSKEQQGSGHRDLHNFWNGSLRAPGVLSTILSTTNCPVMRIAAKSRYREENAHFSDSLLTLTI